MRLSTGRTSAVDQLEIAFEVESDVAELARWIVTYFESQISAGTRFQDGQTIQLGWSSLLLRKVGDVLEVLEPDFAACPIRWCQGLNHTVRHLHLQRAVCGLFGCEPLFPSLRPAGVVSPKFAGSRRYTMSRDEPADSDSGWVFAESGYAGSEGEFCSLYQVALFKIETVPFLALPTSSHVTIGPEFREVTVNGTTKSSHDCELLQRLVASK